jgi:hypothetical protein
VPETGNLAISVNDKSAVLSFSLKDDKYNLKRYAGHPEGLEDIKYGRETRTENISV